MKFIKQSLSLFLSCCLVLLTAPGGFAQQAGHPPAPTDQSLAPPAQSAGQSPVHAAQQTPEQLQQLVAPIALYPDALVAQILAASTYPDQIVEADRWMEKHKDLKGEKLGKEVDKEHWDPSVKALTEFPSVLANMDKNLEWTSSLGDAYVNQQQQVEDAVQTMRDRAEKAGNLKSNSQEKVTTQDQKIVIEPAQPDVVYVPEYDPWIVYGAPIGVWPGWYAYPGLYVGVPGIAFGLGFGIGFFGGFGWGWGHWGFGWHGGGGVMFNHGAWASRSRVFANRGFTHSPGFHGGGGFHGGEVFHGGGGFHGGGFGDHAGGTHSGAFSGFNHGGEAHSFASRGGSSFGGGGFHGGGGGFHGGGGGRR